MEELFKEVFSEFKMDRDTEELFKVKLSYIHHKLSCEGTIDGLDLMVRFLKSDLLRKHFSEWLGDEELSEKILLFFIENINMLTELKEAIMNNINKEYKENLELLKLSKVKNHTILS